MQVFYHLVYEFQKGLRDLCLFTCKNEFEDKIKKSLESQKIEYRICKLKDNKINVFFGMEKCLEILEKFSCEDLNKITHEEDFILGMMLGYAKPQQYCRYLERKKIPA